MKRMKRPGRILIVDDDQNFVRQFEKTFAGSGHFIESAHSPKDAVDKFKHTNFDIVLLDLVLPPSLKPQEGLGLLGEFSIIPVIVITGLEEHELALKAIEQGAYDFLEKPLNPDMLKVVIERAIDKNHIETELRLLWERESASDDDLGIAGESENIKYLRRQIRKHAVHDVNVLITGPSGSGKELVARAIHNLSPRNNRPFVPLNCGALPENLFEGELFGSLKGSFTGSAGDRDGFIKSAEGGTLFLDEIGELALPSQSKLLRFLQDRKYYPLGGREEREADVRIISATNEDLEELVDKDKFRGDLFYRIKGVQLKTEPLEKRLEDIPIIAKKVVSKYSHGEIKLSSKAYSWLMNQTWKGNVRELHNVLETATKLSMGKKEISVEDLHELKNGNLAPEKNIFDESSLEAQVNAFEKKIIISTIEAAGSFAETSRRLGVHRHTLRNKMKKLDIKIP